VTVLYKPILEQKAILDQLIRSKIYIWTFLKNFLLTISIYKYQTYVARKKY